MSNLRALHLSDATDRFVTVFAALSEPVRVRIIQMMLENAPADLPCTTLDEELPIAKSTISYHVGILRRAGLVEVHKAGRNYFYQLRTDRMEAYAAAFLDHLRAQSAAV
ncbi:MAG TPA: metalloregulator ArsR/SmtB family transcription factor [Amycolatopsis sp.]|nr:metalloregulator ArsR/SmtB family transcription factor [Amycolatopsis sp.]